MIQRIQSIYLLAAVLAFAAIFFTNYFMVTADGLNYIFNTQGLSLVDPEGNKVLFQYLPLLILHLSTIVLSMVAIFLFKNRKMQIRLCQFTLLVNTLLIGGIFYYSEVAMEHLKSSFHLTLSATPDYKLASILPMISIFFILQAIRGIKKDEALVRAADRIR